MQANASKDYSQTSLKAIQNFQKKKINNMLMFLNLLIKHSINKFCSMVMAKTSRRSPVFTLHVDPEYDITKNANRV